jgi:glutaredoxin/glutathione-dependent peroxiredoxin
MSISVGDKIPEASFKVMRKEGLEDVSTTDIFSGKKVVLFAVPGAYTPTCHLKHLPGFRDNLAALKSKGVDTVACVAVNDVFVLDAWAKQSGADGRILFLSDGNADFTKKLGLDFDASAASLGTRSKRYAMLVDDGVVKVLNVEDVPSVADKSSAEELLKSM